MTDAEQVKQEMAAFWGTGPGSDEQLAHLADRFRALSRDQVVLLGGVIPRTTPGSDIGLRCDRLRDLVAGVLQEAEPKKSVRSRLSLGGG